MIVVDPNSVGGPNEHRQMPGEFSVDAKIALECLAPELRQTDPIVEQWPQSAVRKPGIEFAIVGFGEIDCRVGYPPGANDPGLLHECLGKPAAPPEPQAFAWRQGFVQGCSQPARAA